MFAGCLVMTMRRFEEASNSNTRNLLCSYFNLPLMDLFCSGLFAIFSPKVGYGVLLRRRYPEDRATCKEYDLSRKFVASRGACKVARETTYAARILSRKSPAWRSRGHATLNSFGKFNLLVKNPRLPRVHASRMSSVFIRGIKTARVSRRH